MNSLIQNRLFTGAKRTRVIHVALAMRCCTASSAGHSWVSQAHPELAFIISLKKIACIQTYALAVKSRVGLAGEGREGGTILTCENIEKPAVCGIVLGCLYLELCPARRFQELQY